MSLIDRTFRLKNDVGGLGLDCTASGVSLAGVPLLRMTPTGLAPRPAAEIDALMKGAYGPGAAPGDLSPGLEVIAKALNQGDLGRAMVGAVRLRLPELTHEGAARLAYADEALTKYDENEPRDERGRWTTAGGGSAQPARLIPVSVPAIGTPERAQYICLMASKQCQITALNDKSRTGFFAHCQKMEDVCLRVLDASPRDPDQQVGVIFPDHTLVMIQDGSAIVTHIGGQQLRTPLH